jgi:hypothetical protein
MYRIGGFEFGVHNWAGVDGRVKRQMSTLRVYDEEHELFEQGTI